MNELLNEEKTNEKHNREKMGLNKIREMKNTE